MRSDLIKALVRVHRWRRRVESGQARSITHLAEQESVTDGYLCRPDIVETISYGRRPKWLRQAEMLGNGPLGWAEQQARLGCST